jgi:TRAP-type C4-dicarboxylate transport system substrate-binding protein
MKTRLLSQSNNSVSVAPFSRRSFLKTAGLAGLASTLAPALLQAAGAAKIRLATLAPKDTSYHQALKAMAEKWSKAPGGGVELVIYTDGTMGGESDMVRRMRVGQLQAAMLTVGGLAEIDSGTAALQKMPVLYRSLEEAMYVREKIRPLLQKRLAAKGFHLLNWADSGWVRLFSTTAAVTPDDFKKLKMFVWSGDKDHIEMLQAEGYRPVPLEYTDTLTSLRTGLIEAVGSTPLYALAGQFHTSASHMLEMNWVPLVGGTVITTKAWEAIPAEAREVLAKAAEEAGAEIQAKGRQESEEAVKAMVKRGLTVHKLTPEVEALWIKVGESIQPKIRGRMVPADIFDEVHRLLDEYRSGKR